MNRTNRAELMSSQVVNEEPDARVALDAGDILDRAEVPLTDATVRMASGRRYEIVAGEGADRLVVRARSGEVVLKIDVTDNGPVLSFTSAELRLEATRRLELSAQTAELRTSGDLTVHVGGNRHTRIAGDERLEAARIEAQANEGGVAVKAMEAIRLDGEHIGLNDDPAPAPFAWSAIAGEEEGG